MRFRPSIAWCLGMAVAVVLVTAYLVHAGLAAGGGRLAGAEAGMLLASAEHRLLLGAALALTMLGLAGLLLWRSGPPAGPAPMESGAAQALREREQMLSSINANLAGTCIYRVVYHRDGRMECTYVSPNVERLIGLPSAQFMADAASVFALINPEDLPEFHRAVTQAIATGEPALVAVRVRHTNGGELWMQFCSHLCERRADGAQVRDGVVVDITAIKTAENELRAVRQRLELALRASRTCIWENYVAVNRVMLDTTWADMLGRPPGITVTTARELLAMAHPEDRSAISAASLRAIRGESDDYQVEQRVATAQGGWVWIMSIGRVTARDERGRAVRMVGTNTDITARKQTEERGRDLNTNLEQLVAGRTADLVATSRKLAASERHYRNLVENINQGYYVADRRGLFTYLNPTVATLTGKSERELRGRSVFRLVAEEDRERVVAAYRRWSGEPIREATIEFRVPLEGGRVIWVEQSTTFVRDPAGALLEGRNILRDVTERKAAEAMLRQSNERFFAVFERSPIIIGLLSVPDGRMVEFNVAGVAAFGYTREEAIGRTSVDLNLWADPGDRERYLGELRAKGHVANFEARMRRKNGEIFTVVYSGSLIEIDGRSYSLNSLVDITAQRESESRLNHAIEATNDGLWDWNIVTGEVYFSPQWVRLLGYEPGEVPPRVEFFFTILHPDDVAAVTRMLEEHLAGRVPVKQIEVRLRAKPGEYRWFLDRGKVVARDATGRPLRMVGTITDITERKRVEQANVHSLALLRATLESTADGILTIGADRRIESVNSVFTAMWRIPADVLAAGDEALAIKFVLDQLREPERFLEKICHLYDHPFEESFDTLDFKDGRVFERQSRPMLDEGRPTGRVWSFRDITARRRAEEEREQMEARLRTSHKMEAMGTLAGGIAHDFNNILTGVINYSELARLECPPDHPRLVKFMGDVLACGHRAKDLVRQILLFSRAEEARQEPVRLQNVLEEAFALLRSTLPACAVIEPDIDPRAPLILGNSTQLHQVVMNLGINAAQAIQNQPGRIFVKLHPVELAADAARVLHNVEPGPHVRLEISDTGCGMDETVLARVFDPFFTTKRAGEGTGLGLAVAHGIVRGHRGAITVRSQPGAGTTFEIFLPALAVEIAPARPTLAQQPRGHGERLLLVDDEEIVVETMKMLLERLGYHVTDFRVPGEALARFEAAPGDFDVLITDFMMPGMTGNQLAEKIVACRPDLPVILTSGFFGNYTPEEIRRLNIQALVQKPIELNELTSALARIFGR